MVIALVHADGPKMMVGGEISPMALPKLMPLIEITEPPEVSAVFGVMEAMKGIS